MTNYAVRDLGVYANDRQSLFEGLLDVVLTSPFCSFRTAIAEKVIGPGISGFTIAISSRETSGGVLEIEISADGDSRTYHIAKSRLNEDFGQDLQRMMEPYRAEARNWLQDAQDEFNQKHGG